MDWSTWIARAIRSIASPRVIRQLCHQTPPATNIEEIIPLQITTIITSTYTAILKPVERITEPSTIIDERPVTIFNTVPGLQMHPLTSLLILTTILALVSFLLAGLLICQSRSKRSHKYVSTVVTSQLAHFQANSKVREHYLKLKLLGTEVELRRIKTKMIRDGNYHATQFKQATSLCKKSVDELEHLAHEYTRLSHVAIRSSNLEAEVESLKSTIVSLEMWNDDACVQQRKSSQTIDEAAQKYQDLREEHSREHAKLLMLQADSEKSRANATKEIQELKHKNEGLAGQLKDFETITNEIDVHREVLLEKDEEIASLQADRAECVRDMEDNKAHNLANLADSVKTCKKLEDMLGDARRQMQDLEADRERLNDQLQEFDETKTELKTLRETAATRDSEIASLLVKTEAQKSDKFKSLAELDDFQEKCKDLQVSLSSAQENIQELTLERERLGKQLHDFHNINNEIEARDQAAMQKDVEIASLQAKIEACDKGPQLHTKAVRVGNMRERILEGQKHRLHHRLVRVRGKLQAKTDELSTKQAQINDHKRDLATTKINYAYVNERYEATKKNTELLHSELTTTRAVMKGAAEDADELWSTITYKDTIIQELTRGLEIPSSCAEIVLSQRAKTMDSKKIAERKRNLVKIFDTGAANFKLASGQRGRRHSIAGCETRIQVAELLPGRSKYLMDASENEILKINGQGECRQAAKLWVPGFQDVVKAFKNGRLPYATETLHSLTHTLSAATSSSGLLMLTSKKDRSLDPAFHNRESAADAALWAARTRFNASILFPHALSKRKREADASEALRKGQLIMTYDNRISSIVNQLDKYRAVLRDNDLTTRVASIKSCNVLEKAFLDHISDANTLGSTNTIDKLIGELRLVNQRIHNRTLDSAIDGGQGLRSIISKQMERGGTSSNFKTMT